MNIISQRDQQLERTSHCKHIMGTVLEANPNKGYNNPTTIAGCIFSTLVTDYMHGRPTPIHDLVQLHENMSPIGSIEGTKLHSLKRVTQYPANMKKDTPLQGCPTLIRIVTHICCPSYGIEPYEPPTGERTWVKHNVSVLVSTCLRSSGHHDARLSHAHPMFWLPHRWYAGSCPRVRTRRQSWCALCTPCL